MSQLPAGYVTPGNIERQALQTALTNYALLLASVTTYQRNPVAENLSSITSLATAFGYIPPPKVTYTLDGENQQWTEYQTGIIGAMDALRLQVQRSAGPFSFRSRR